MFLQKKEDNLCNYHVLPLTGLNKTSFGKSNFINSYIKEDYQIVVEVKKEEDIGINFWNHECYHTDYNDGDHHFIVFNIPEEFYEDVDNFREGLYSHFSLKAKRKLRKYAGVSYNKGAYKATHYSLLLLNKHDKLREVLEKELETEIDPEQELASKPLDHNFIGLTISEDKE